MINRIAAFAFAALMAISANAYTEVVDGIEWTYTVRDGEATLGLGDYDVDYLESSSAVSIYTKGDITIPSSLNGYPVTRIGDYAFYLHTGLTSVTIPDSVTSIGVCAFYYCKGLTSVTIPDAVTIIENHTFEECSSLTSVTIPDSVTSIGSHAFYYCTGLTSMTIPDSVESIGREAFAGCSGLTSVAIGTSLMSVGEYAFSGCSGLTSVHISDLAAWCRISFHGASSNPLFWAKNLNGDLRIPDGVTGINGHTFVGCSGLKSVTIPDSVEDIGSESFAGCSGLKSVTIPQCVCSLGLSAVFSGAYSSITDVVISDSVTNIARNAFYGCSGLTSVTIPDSVESIGREAFYGCSGLKSVTIPGSVESIGREAFAYCRGLANVTIGNSVTNISYDTFSGCDSRMSFAVSGNNPMYKSANGLLLSKDGETLIIGVNGNVTIPKGVRSIGYCAFYDCSGLTSVTIPDSVENIGMSAFCGCSGLKSVTIPSSVTSIGSTAFANCSGLTSVTIPNSVESIPSSAFSSCTGLTSVTIGDSVTSIGWFAFSDCTGLTSVTIPDSVKSLGSNAFYYCSGLKSVTMQGDAPSSVGSYAFVGVASGCKVRIPRGNETYTVTAGKWQGLTVEYYDLPRAPTIDGDEGATVEGDSETGYTVKPSDGKKDVVVTIPDGVEPAKVTVEVAVTVETVTANGANVRVMKGEDDITEHLDLVAVTQDGVINLASAQVKEEVAKEALDTEKGAKFDISDTESPELTTAETKPGLVYTLLEGATLEDMKNGDSKLGDGTKWTPTITVKGGTSGFYTIKVEK